MNHFFLSVNKSLLLTLTLLLGLTVLKAQTTKKVLFLGNSYTYYNGMPEIAEQLALLNGDNLTHDQYTPGGYRLLDHATSMTSINKIQSDDWDLVVLQDHSLGPAYNYLDLYNGAEQLIQLIHADDLCLNKTIFYMTWGRENSSDYPYDEHQQLTTDAYNIMAEIFDTEVAPVGAAWKKVRDENDPIDLYVPDGSHPTYAGSYLAACVFYATIFDKSPVGLSYTGSLSKADATYLQEKAFEAYNEYVTLGLIHTGISEDTVTDVYRAILNNSQSELNSLIANGALKTTFDFTYTGFSTQSQVNTTLEYIITQSGNQVANETIPVSMTIPPNVCVHQTATYPLNMDLSNVEQGLFDADILLNGNLIAYYNLEMQSAVSEFNLARDIVLFPAPVKDQLTIRLPRSYEIIYVEIFNTTGQVLVETHLKNKSAFQLQLNHLSPGVYFLMLDVDGNQVARKLIKN